MKQVLSTLQRIEHDAEAIGMAIKNEGQVYKEEL